MLEKRKAYESKLEGQLAQWKAEIGVLEAKAKRAEVDAKVTYDKVLDGMQRKYDEAGRHLRGLKTASDDAWEDVKTGTEKVWLEVKALFHSSAEKH